MKDKTFRINKTRQDQLVEELAAEISNPASYTRELPAEKMLEAFTRLSLAGLRDYQDQLEKTGAPAEEYLDPAVMWLRSRQLGECAWEHFRQHAQARFHLAFVELMHESLGFSDSIYARNCGASAEEIEDSLPRREDLEQNVLRHAVTRLGQLPRYFPDYTQLSNEVEDVSGAIQKRIAVLIFRDLPLWTYDHNAVSITIQKWIGGVVQKFRNPDKEATAFGNEAADLLWEHIGGAVQAMLAILTEWVLMLSKHSFVKRHDLEIDPRQARELQPSKEKLKEIASNVIGLWIDGLPFDWRGSGRPVKTTSERILARERLALELHDIAVKLIAAGERVTWDTLAQHRNRPPNSPQGGESLRKEAAALKLSLSEFKSEKN